MICKIGKSLAEIENFLKEKYIQEMVLDISWSLGKVGFLLVSLVSGTCFFIGLFVIGATSCFWTIQSIEIINIFTNGGIFMGSYPFSIYRWWFRHFFTFIVPLACVNYYPSLFLLEKIAASGASSIGVQLAPFAGFFFLGITMLFWRWGVLHYQSTGH